MLFALIILSFITLGGLILTHFYDGEDSLLVRLCAGNVVGSSLFGLAAFLVGCAFGLTAATVLIALALALAPLLLLMKNDWRARVFRDFQNVPNRFSRRGGSVVFYVSVLALLYFFFDRAMIETAQGIFTGGSQNLGDLPFHLGAIFSFSDGGNLPPENPSFAFAKFTYPFMTDFLAACFVRAGANVREAMLWQNVTFGFSLVVLLENFTRRLTGNRLAGKLAPVILLFSGGLGFVIFFRDFARDGRPFFEFLWNLPADYTIREKGIRWGNALTTLFLTQRSLLLGMPIALIVLTKLWEIFDAEPRRGRDDKLPESADELKEGISATVFPFSVFFVGLLAGTLPLVHVHSLAVLFVVAAFLFFFRLDRWREWLWFAVGVCVIAVPELVWVMTGSATRLKEFVGWNLGWSAGDENVFLFWAKNLGLFIPLLMIGIYLLQRRINCEVESRKSGVGREKPETENRESKTEDRRPKSENLLYFYLPFLLVFVVANLFKLAPWEWDNIKVLIYWFVASIPFVALVLANLWERSAAFKIMAAACLMILTFSGAVDVWRVVSKQINYQVFSRDAVKIAEQIKQKTAPDALFLNAPTYNSAVVLSGRRSLMRYSGHLSSYGIDYVPREAEVKRIYEGTALAETFLKKNRVDYVIISPEETANVVVNAHFFSKYPVIAESGDYRVYQIKK